MRGKSIICQAHSRFGQERHYYQGRYYYYERIGIKVKLYFILDLTSKKEPKLSRNKLKSLKAVTIKKSCRKDSQNLREVLESSKSVEAVRSKLEKSRIESPMLSVPLKLLCPKVSSPEEEPHCCMPQNR